MSGAVSNPTWCLRDNHVHQVLQLVLDYWSDWWGIERVDLPPPLRKRDGVGRSIYRRMKKLRIQQLHESQQLFPHVELGANTTVNDLLWPERRLHAAIVRRAVLDFCQYYISPYKSDQRIALNSYWWFMGYPIMMPLNLSWADEQDIKHGRTTRHILKPSEDVFERTGWTREMLTVEFDSRPRYLPWEEEEGDIEMIDWMSAESCCKVLGLDLPELRRRVHTIPPNWGD